MFSMIAVCALGQTKVAIDPVISPSLFRYNDQITVTYDVTGTSLSSLTNAWIWVWIPGTNINAKYNFNPASSNTSQTSFAKFTRSVENGRTLFKITFKPSDFFASDISVQQKLGMLLKGDDWANGQTTDFVTDFWDGSFQVKLLSPTQRPIFVTNGDEITIEAETPVSADYTLFINDVSVNTQDDITAYTYTHVVAETSGYGTVKLVATSGGSSNDVSFQYIISSPSPQAARPAGIIPGINYVANDKVTLCLWAPGKSSVYLRGDFSDWLVLPENLMKRDGEFFWIALTGITPGQEYGFQYLVNETVFVADPYADKILDPDDQFIPGAVYPNLKAFPEEVLSANWYENRVSVFQTGQTAYSWKVADFQKPEKEKLIVYELLIRDFFGPEARSYQSLIDTIGYFKSLGINAIELMPIMEFNGNESWGYNPTFMFAPDKYYGTKNKLKEFVDVCHQNGIAVILDIAMNHQDMPNSYVMMDFNFDTGKPSASNKWFNTDARHPFNVFFDMNHESTYTKAYLDTVNHYWLNEYKIDGFRFDLSKGFTQTNNPDNVGAWSAYDASRIAILKRMADEIWEHTPDAYVILEHLSVDSEEKELAEYRAAEGKGMMLWGNLNHAYSENAMGFPEDISRVYHGTRSWSVPHVVSYMESHDEERMMYRNMKFGKTTPSYDIKSFTTALKRIEAASTIFYTVPGPKMLWQFGELGYDYSINYCSDGTINNDCRVSSKPVRWDYQADAQRDKLQNHISDLLRLRHTYDVFTDGTASLTAGVGLVKQLMLKNDPYTATPANADQMNAVVVVNFDVSAQSVAAAFPHGGVWYDYYEGAREVSVTGTSFTLSLKPGEYKLLTDHPIGSPLVTALEGETGETADLSVYPNPVERRLFIRQGQEGKIDISLSTTQGLRVTVPRLDDGSWDVSGLANGIYILEVKGGEKTIRTRILKR
jgi:1,4-alpha-glucan branching enzyme